MRMTNDQTTYRAMLADYAAELRASAGALVHNAGIAAAGVWHSVRSLTEVIAWPFVAPLAAALRLRSHRRALGLDTSAVDNCLTLAASGAMLLGGVLILWCAQ